MPRRASQLGACRTIATSSQRAQPATATIGGTTSSDIGLPYWPPLPFPPEVASERPTAVTKGPLYDTFGRKHTYLRISLTDRCNLRCKYCMPGDEEEPIAHATDPELLTTEELHRIFHLFVDLGVRKVRLTGGEPTIRRDFGDLVAGLGRISAAAPKPLTLGITTNGVKLSRHLPTLREAGLRNINLSLDTLVPAKFPLLTRRPVEMHKRVLDTLYAVAGQPDAFKLKVNCVLMRGVNEDEIGDFVDLTEHLPIEVRFLEFMPFDRNGWSANRLVPQADIIRAVERHVATKRGLGPEALKVLPPDTINDVANLWRVDGWQGRLGMIASMTDAFCGGCNRLRLTSDGQIRNCLFGEEGWSLRDALRAGATDEALRETVATAVRAKHQKLGGKKDMHELKARGALGLPMVALGG